MADALSKQGLVLTRKCTGLQGSQAISFTVYSRQLAKASPCTWHVSLQSFSGETLGLRFLYLTALQSIWTAAVTLRSFSNPKQQSSYTWHLLNQTGLCKQHKSLPCSCLPIPSALQYNEYISNHVEARSWGPKGCPEDGASMRGTLCLKMLSYHIYHFGINWSHECFQWLV